MLCSAIDEVFAQDIKGVVFNFASSFPSSSITKALISGDSGVHLEEHAVLGQNQALFDANQGLA